MKIVASAIALGIMAIGAVGILIPSGLVWIAQHSITSGAFYVIATVRVAFGVVLIWVAPFSRAPRTLRVVGVLILIAGIATAVMGLTAIERARALIEWWLAQGLGVVRLTGVLVLAVGGLIAYACAPARFGGPNR
jgi:glucan phosphoethanolaminetransferase (alkaline phosphatase superfamily)